MNVYLQAELVPDISDFFIPILSPSLIAKKNVVQMNVLLFTVCKDNKDVL